VATVFGREGIGLNFKLLDGIDRRNLGCCAAEIVIIVHSIDQEIIRRGALPVGRETRYSSFAALLSSSSARRGYPGIQPGQLSKVASIQWKVLHFAVIYDFAQFGIFGLGEIGISLHSNRFSPCAHPRSEERRVGKEGRPRD